MAYCPSCGEKIKDGAQFCTRCGMKLAQTEEVPQTGPEATAASGPKRLIMCIVAVLLVVLIIILLITATAKPQPSTSTLDAPQTSEQEPSEQAAEPAQEEEAPVEEEAAEEDPAARLARVAQAYEKVLANPENYFSEPWYDQLPDNGYSYCLGDVTGDDIPELIFGVHYSNIGSHTSGGFRIVPFVYDEVSDSALPPNSGSSFEPFMEPWNEVGEAADGHALMSAYRTNGGASYEYTRIQLVDRTYQTTVVSESEGAMSPLDFRELDDHSLIEQLLGGSVANAQGIVPTTIINDPVRLLHVED